MKMLFKWDKNIPNLSGSYIFYKSTTRILLMVIFKIKITDKNVFPSIKHNELGQNYQFFALYVCLLSHSIFRHLVSPH